MSWNTFSDTKTNSRQHAYNDLHGADETQANKNTIRHLDSHDSCGAWTSTSRHSVKDHHPNRKNQAWLSNLQWTRFISTRGHETSTLRGVRHDMIYYSKLCSQLSKGVQRPRSKNSRGEWKCTNYKASKCPDICLASSRLEWEKYGATT